VGQSECRRGSKFDAGSHAAADSTEIDSTKGGYDLEMLTGGKKLHLALCDVKRNKLFIKVKFFQVVLHTMHAANGDGFEEGGWVGRPRLMCRNDKTAIYTSSFHPQQS
jgi:hypothetical protein